MTVSDRSINRWAARIIPSILVGLAGYATWIIVVPLCVDYLLKGYPSPDRERRYGAAITVLVLYFLLLCLTAITYLRLLETVLWNPGYVPRGHGQDQNHEKRIGKQTSQKRSNLEGDSLRSNPYPDGRESIEMPENNGHTMQDVQLSDFPVSNLADFYSKEVFVCERDARPPWCSRCLVFKPDRAHHCSEVDRCVRKMDHFCPWVGGVIGETSFKFFLQFLVYATMYCVYALIIMVVFVTERHKSKRELNSHWIILLALAAFFTFLAVGMAGSSIWLALNNVTTIENLTRKTKVWQFAVRLSHMSMQTDESGLRSFDSTVAHPNTSAEPTNTQPGQGPNRNLARDVSDQPPFAILLTQPGENPWDIGTLKNWKAVMGERIRDWSLPIKHSPCCNHDQTNCSFALGPVFERIKREARLINPDHSVSRTSPKKHQRRPGAGDGLSGSHIKTDGGNSETDAEHRGGV